MAENEGSQDGGKIKTSSTSEARDEPRSGEQVALNAPHKTCSNLQIRRTNIYP